MRQLSPYCSHLGSTQPPRGVAIVLTERILERCRIGLQRQGKPRSQPGFGALRNFDPANVRFGWWSQRVDATLYPERERWSVRQCVEVIFEALRHQRKQSFGIAGSGASR